MGKKIRFVLSVFCCLILLCGTLAGTASAAAPDAKAVADALLDGQVKAADVQSVQAYVDDTLANGAGRSAEWEMLALLRADAALDFSAYYEALHAYLAENTVSAPATREKIALVLVGGGYRDDAFVAETLADAIGKQGIMSEVFGLHLLNNGCESPAYTSDALIRQILSHQLADGGFAITGTTSDVDVTAMTLAALAPHVKQNEAARKAADDALSLLSARQDDNGGFQSYGKENAESAAQVLIALCACGIEPLTDARFQKNGSTALDALLRFRLDDGSFCHAAGGASDHAATAQALCALTALQCDTSLFLFDTDVQPEKTTEPVKAENTVSVRVWICLGLALCALLLCVILWLRKKRSLRTYLAILLVTAAAICAVCFLHIQSAEGYYGTDDAPEHPVGTVTLAIRCDTVIGKPDTEDLPADGAILPETTFSIGENETVYSVLMRAAKKYKLHTECENTEAGTTGAAYVSGIAHLYEMQFGALSGWIYQVNGETPSVGCGAYALKDGDAIVFAYSCDMGQDFAEEST